MSIWPGAWASRSITKDGSRAPASRSRSSGGSQRSGRLLISTAVPCSRRPRTPHARRSRTVGGCRTSPRQAAPCGGRARSPAGSAAATIRARHGFCVHPQLAVHGCRDEVEPRGIASLWSRPPSSRMSASMPLSSRNAHRASGRWRSLDDADLLGGRPLGAEPVRDPQLGAVVGEHEPLVAELDTRQHHLVDGGAAVAPVRVQVAIALQRGGRSASPPSTSGPPTLASSVAR